MIIMIIITTITTIIITITEPSTHPTPSPVIAVKTRRVVRLVGPAKSPDIVVHVCGEFEALLGLPNLSVLSYQLFQILALLVIENSWKRNSD